MADNLESYFKKHLSGDTPDDGDWNVPSDSVWDKVAPEIQTTRGLFIPWKYLYIIGVLLVVGLAMIIWFATSPDQPIDNENMLAVESIEEGTQIDDAQYANTTKQAEQTNNDIATERTETSNKIIEFQVENQTENVQEIKDAALADNIVEQNNSGINSSVNEELADNQIPSSAGDNMDKQLVEKKTQGIDSKEIKENISITPKINADKKTEVTISQNKNVIYATNAGENAKTATSQIKINSDQPASIPIGQLSALSLEQVSILAIEYPEKRKPVQKNSLATNAPHKGEPFNNKGRYGLGAFYAPTFTSTSIKGQPESGEMQTGNMYQYSGAWGFEIRYFLSQRFTLVGGVGKSEIVSWSKSMSDFGYDSSTEHDMGNGEKENTSPVPMQTPFGEINTEITYRFPSDELFPDGEMMNSEMETHQEVRYLSVPIGLEFNIIPFNRFNWFAEGGLQYNRALKDATQFSTRILHDGHDMDVVAEQMENQPAFTENYLNFYIGTGVNYQISKSFQINGSFRYFGNITKVNIQDNMSTYVNGFSLKFGIVYLF